MDDEQGKTPEQPTQDGGQQPPWGDDFDPQRAWETIQKLRAFEKDAKKASRLEKQLSQLQQAEEERKRAEMNEAERLRADLEATKAALEAQQRELAAERRRALIVTTATQAGMNDPGDAVHYLSLDDDSDGEAVQAALAQLKKAKPYLFKQREPTLSPTNPEGGKGQESDAAKRARLFGQSESPMWGTGG